MNALAPRQLVFDGYFVHSRGGGAARLDGVLDFLGTNAGTPQLRTDLGVPIMVFETETDLGPLVRYALARQPDTNRLRTWEVSGTSHADAYLVGGSFSSCSGKINDGPHHYVVTAAMGDMLRWVDGGPIPPASDRIQVGGSDGATIARDAHGIALGGIRTPSVDVPVETLSGQAPPGSSYLCGLFGSATPFDQATLHSLYPTRQAYLDAFDKSLDDAIARGFVRAADRDEFAAEARAAAV
jgi:hypothetical protein